MAQVGVFSLVEVVEPDGHKHGKVWLKWIENEMIKELSDQSVGEWIIFVDTEIIKNDGKSSYRNKESKLNGKLLNEHEPPEAW